MIQSRKAYDNPNEEQHLVSSGSKDPENVQIIIDTMRRNRSKKWSDEHKIKSC